MQTFYEIISIIFFMLNYLLQTKKNRPEFLNGFYLILLM